MSVGEGTRGRVPERVTAAIVGSQRCGTTSLAKLLETHPDVCLAAGKELHWFDDAAVQRSGVDAARWSRPFAHYAGEPVILDASPSYLYLPGCIEALHRHNPDARLIAILREPAERARSHHAHNRRLGLTQELYWRALLQEQSLLGKDRTPLADKSPSRVASLRDRGRYSRQVANLREWFPEALVLRFDELIHDTPRTVRRVTDHLGLAPLPPSAVLPWLNERDRSPWPTPLDLLVRWTLRKEVRATEGILGWPAGSLSAARLGKHRRERPKAGA